MTSVSQNPGSSVDRDNPWPGLASFTEDQRAFFHGRDEEIIDLTQLAERRPLVVLFGQSGLGKSSILQAGVFPRLRTDGFCPIYVRLDHGERAPSPTEQIKELVKTETAKAGTWTKPGSAKPGESLWEFFHHRDDRLVDRDGLGVVPVLVMDQFEELFTLGAARGERRDRALAFIKELAELVENRPPANLVARLDKSPDEMEAFDFSRTDYRVILSLREDFLPDLESLKTIMPALMQKRMRLARMTGKQALDAVLKPGAGIVDEDVARAIVEFVAGARGGSAERLAELDVEPALLSVVCRELNERRRAQGQSKITKEQVSGDRREILTDFYERSVADLPEGMRAFVEDHLLTKSGFRDNLALETALEFPAVTQPLIDTLVARRLLRIEDRLGVQRVELTHDVLAEVIRTSRDTRQQRLVLEKERQRERLTRRRMWLARTIAAGLLVACTGVSWVAWRAIRSEREQARLREDAEKLRTAADAAREREARLRVEAEAQELAALRKAYASDMNALQRALDMDNLGRARELLNRHRPKSGGVDLRGWEWRYLWQFCQSDAQSIVRDTFETEVRSIAISTDGNWAAVGHRASGALTVHNLRTKEVIAVPAGSGAVHVTFSPREPLLAIAVDVTARTGQRAGRVLIWDLNTRQTVRELSVVGLHSGMAFSSDGGTLVVGSAPPQAPGEISIWRMADGHKLAGWPVGRSSRSTAASWFAATRDGSAAAFVETGAKLGIIDLKSGRERWSVVATDDGIRNLAFSSDGRVLASGHGLVDTAIHLWDAATGRSLGRLEGQRGFTTGMIFLEDGKHLVSSSADQSIRLWNLETRSLVRAFRGHKTEVHALALAPDQRTLVSGGKDGSVYVWDLTADRGGSALGTVAVGLDSTWTFAPDGNSIIAIDSAGHVTRRQGLGFRQKATLITFGTKLRPFARAVMDPKRPLLAVVTDDGKCQVWNWERGTLLREWIENAEIGSLQPQLFSNDGAKLLLATINRTNSTSFHEWEIASGRETHSFNIPVRISGSRQVDRLVYSPDGRHAVWFRGSGEGVDAATIDLTTGRMGTLKAKTYRVATGPNFSPDSKVVVVPSFSGLVQILDCPGFTEIATLSGWLFGTHSAGFSVDSKRLVVGSTGQESVTVWDFVSRERLLTLEAHAGTLSPVAFSPDGNVLAGYSSFGASGGNIYFWRAPSWAEIEAAERNDGTKPPQ